MSSPSSEAKIIKIDFVGSALVVLYLVLVCTAGWTAFVKDPDSYDVPIAIFLLAPAGITGYLYTKRSPAAKKSKAIVELALLAGVYLFIVAALGPVFRSAHSSAAQAKCISSLKRLGLGVLMYESDNDDRFPPGQAWRTLSDPYRTHDPDPDRCPNSHAAWTYAMNSSLSALRSEIVVAPIKTIMLFEADSAFPNVSAGSKQVVNRHFGTSFACFCDGHTKRLNSDDLWSPKK